MINLARLFSFVFHPVFIPVYLILLSYISDPYLQYIIPVSRMKPILLLLLINTILMPLISFFYLRYKGVFHSLFLESKNERKIGVLILFAFHLVTYILWRNLALPASFMSLFLGILITLAAVFFITSFFKISLHTTAFGGLIGALLGLFRAHGFLDYSILALALLGLGLVASSRLLMQAHRPSEVNWGAILGFVTLYVCSAFSLYI